MRSVLASAVLICACATPRWSVDAAEAERAHVARESRVPVGQVELYAREIGRGQPILVLHGGPDFDHSYLVPDLDRLSDSFRLIYYDQRGRGQSAAGVQPEDVSLVSDVSDLDQVRAHFQLGSAAVLGHSWGTVLALEYAIRHPEHVSHLILMNPAPASADDYRLFRKAYIERQGGELDRLKAIAATDAFKEGDPDAVAAYYRVHFKPALRRPEDLETVLARLRASFTREGVLKAWAIEDRLKDDTWLSEGYNLLPQLASLNIPTLVVYSERDFIPPDVAVHIAHAIPNARLAMMKECGHFSYLECPVPLRKEIDDFFRSAKTTARLQKRR